jgi:GDPmannose 4,6-dehydratase
MMPASPYGAAKLYAFNMVRIYREAYGLFACNGILFNHESPRRGIDFVTSKIGLFAKAFHNGAWDGNALRLGNLDARRDWGHARDYVDGMWRMLQADKSDDFVLATGLSKSVREFVDAAIPNLVWSGQGADETGTDPQGRIVVCVDANLLRPIDVPALSGDSAKARKTLGWSPQTDFTALVSEMMAA